MMQVSEHYYRKTRLVNLYLKNTLKQDVLKKMIDKSLLSWELQAPSSKLQAPSSKLQAPSSKLQAPSSKLQAPSSKLQAPSSKLQAPSSKLQAPSSKLQAPSSKLQAPSSKLQAPSFHFLHAQKFSEDFISVKNRAGCNRLIYNDKSSLCTLNHTPEYC